MLAWLMDGEERLVSARLYSAVAPR
jgi:hypothetical protein